MLIKKISALCIMVLLLVFSVVTFGQATGNEVVRVGLNFTNKNASTIKVTSQEPLALFASVNRIPVKIFDCDSKGITFEKGNTSRVNVVYDQRFSTYAELYQEVGNIRNANSGSFYYYNQGWYLVLGRFESSSQAKNKLGSFSGVQKNKLAVKTTLDEDVYLLSGNKILFAHSSEAADFFVASSNYPNSGVVTYDGKTYRGGIGANRSAVNDMAVINYLMMDHYVYGILPKEMSGTWPKEALKAQAVVARSFTINSFEKHGDEGYDTCDTTNCQVYGGYSVEAPGSNLAVDETSGELLYYGDELVVGYYHSNSGGRTASIENVWSTSVPYLKSVDDPYSVGSPNTDWIVLMTPKEITDKLAEKNYFIGTLNGVKVIEVAEDGRVQEIRFIGSKGTATLKKEEMRKVFGYKKFKSIWFEVVTDNVLSVANTQEYSQVVLTDAKVYNGSLTKSLSGTSNVVIQGVKGQTLVDMSPAAYKFVGHGFGHGIGMSQWGAKKMADDGFSYQDILYHYYTNTQIIK